jgi:hypothetical protein
MTETHPQTERETQHTEAVRAAARAKRDARKVIAMHMTSEPPELAAAYRTIALQHLAGMATIVANELTDEASAVCLGIPGSRQRLGTIRVLASDVEALRAEIGGAA